MTKLTGLVKLLGGESRREAEIREEYRKEICQLTGNVDQLKVESASKQILIDVLRNKLSGLESKLSLLAQQSPETIIVKEMIEIIRNDASVSPIQREEKRAKEKQKNAFIEEKIAIPDKPLISQEQLDSVQLQLADLQQENSVLCRKLQEALLANTIRANDMQELEFSNISPDSSRKDNLRIVGDTSAKNREDTFSFALSRHNELINILGDGESASLKRQIEEKDTAIEGLKEKLKELTAELTEKEKHILALERIEESHHQFLHKPTMQPKPERTSNVTEEWALHPRKIDEVSQGLPKKIPTSEDSLLQSNPSVIINRPQATMAPALPKPPGRLFPATNPFMEELDQGTYKDMLASNNSLVDPSQKFQSNVVFKTIQEPKNKEAKAIDVDELIESLRINNKADTNKNPYLDDEPVSVVNPYLDEGGDYNPFTDQKISLKNPYQETQNDVFDPFLQIKQEIKESPFREVSKPQKIEDKFISTILPKQNQQSPFELHRFATNNDQLPFHQNSEKKTEKLNKMMSSICLIRPSERTEEQSNDKPNQVQGNSERDQLNMRLSRTAQEQGFAEAV